MKKFVILFACVFLAMGFVFAGNGVQDGTGVNHEAVVDAGGQNGTMLISQNQIQAGSYNLTNGQKLEIKTNAQNRLQLHIGNYNVDCDCNLTQEQVQNKTQLKVALSNGRNAEIKVMPTTASETALHQLRLKNCNESTNCSLELKEVGQGNQTKLAYELNTQKQSKVLGLFKARMQVQAQIDAENGEIIQTNKPWWAFLASEDNELDE